MNISLYRMFSEDRWVGIYKYSSRLSILRSILRSIVQQQTYKLVSDGSVMGSVMGSHRANSHTKDSRE